MDLHQAQALARIEEGQPDNICTVLQDSGYGDLAGQWLTATREFQTAARQSRTTDPQQHASSAKDRYNCHCLIVVSWLSTIVVRKVLQPHWDTLHRQDLLRQRPVRYCPLPSH